MPIRTGPCDSWPIRLDCCQGIPADPDPTLVARWQAVASQILWALSGRRHGPCPTTIRPCARSCLDKLGVGVQWGSAAGRWVPYISDGRWYNASVCGCSTDCSCTDLCEVYLPGPVYDVVEVRVDGAVLDPAAYRVDAPGRLVRRDRGCWPECSNMAAACDEPGAFCVRYRVGLPLDEAAIAAVSELTCEFLKAACPGQAAPDCRCRLPGNVQRVVRQGVTVDLLTEPTSIYRSEGRTSLPMVDLWLAAVNPDRLSRPSRVLSPDFRPPRTTTWP